MQQQQQQQQPRGRASAQAIASATCAAASASAGTLPRGTCRGPSRLARRPVGVRVLAQGEEAGSTGSAVPTAGSSDAKGMLTPPRRVTEKESVVDMPPEVRQHFWEWTVPGSTLLTR
eukprot:347947-Chlamydomonas_euryale.AAC.11